MPYTFDPRSNASEKKKEKKQRKRTALTRSLDAKILHSHYLSRLPKREEKKERKEGSYDKTKQEGKVEGGQSLNGEWGGLGIHKGGSREGPRQRVRRGRCGKETLTCRQKA